MRLLALIGQLVGLSMLFVGSVFLNQAQATYDVKQVWQWRAGNLLQAIGFVVSLGSIFLAYYVGH